MAGYKTKNVQEYNCELKSPNKLRSSIRENESKKKDFRNTPVKATRNSSRCNLTNKQKLSEKELSSCLNTNEQSDSEQSSEDENEIANSIKNNTTKTTALWRISDSPVNSKKLSSIKKNEAKNETFQSPCERIKNMSPAKSQQLSKARRSLNLELCNSNEKNKDTKSQLKITLKRKLISYDDEKDVSPAKLVRTNVSSSVRNTHNKQETPPSLKRNLRAREDIKLPLWRRVDSSPLKEIQSRKIDFTEQMSQKEKPQTPDKTASEKSVNTPKSNRKVSFGSPKNDTGSRTYGTPVSRKHEGRGFLTPIMAEKNNKNQAITESPLDKARIQLHISTVPTCLPCREKEFNNIHDFLKRKINDHAGGCMYISGVPGTGKTATVHAVVRSLQQLADDNEIDPFDFIEVNGLRLTEPRQAYVRILQTLNGQKLTPEQAQRILDKRFSGNTKRSTVLLVDELDYLCNRRQDVVYNILDWPSKQNSGLIVLTISNTMDLPERTLKGRVTSRMGLTRLMFQPYTHHQLQEIVKNRLEGNKSFHPDAIQLVARKVAAVSGDARRALDICRRATELVSGKNTVTVLNIESALTQLFTGTRVLAIRSCREMERLILRALRDETQRTGVDESNVRQVYNHLISICSLEDCPTPTVGDVLRICTSLAASGLIVAEKGRPDLMRKLSLNVSSDDIHYALDC